MNTQTPIIAEGFEDVSRYATAGFCASRIAADCAAASWSKDQPYNLAYLDKCARENLERLAEAFGARVVYDLEAAE